MKVQEKKHKLLFLVPAKTAKGGIVNYFNVLENNFSLPVEYFVRGARSWPNREGKIKEVFRAWNDLKTFKKRIKRKDVLLVQTSTSLGAFAVIRDGFFLRAAQKRQLITITFFRGWDEKFEKVLSGWKLKLFKRFFFKSKAIIVLSKKFEKKLRDWGYQGDIYVETTVVDEVLLRSFNMNDFQNKINHLNLEEVNLLFLARTEEAKGLFEAIEAFIKLKKKFQNIKLTIAGDGFSKQKAIEKIISHQLQDSVSFAGFITGEKKVQAFRNSHIYLFPSYTEGMPNSVLEAMAFGLPIVTTPVGGITDFFVEGKNGYYVEIKSVEKIVEKVSLLLTNTPKYMEISKNNLDFARREFMTSVLVNNLEKKF